MRKFVYCTVLAIMANAAWATKKDLRLVHPSFHSVEFILTLRDEADGELAARQTVKAMLNDAIAVYETDPVASKSEFLRLMRGWLHAVDRVRFVYGQTTLLLDGPFQCLSQVDSQWVLSVDNPYGPYPMVAWRADYFPGIWNMPEWQLLVHETLSALGVVDDAYQVSSLIMDAIQLADPIAEFEVEFRSLTPRFSVGAEDRCYDQDEIQVARTGSLTGIGGGGESMPMIFKRTVSIGARDWWAEHVGSPRSQAYGDFRKRILLLGFENFERKMNFTRPDPSPMEFVRSRRSGRMSVRMEYDSGELWGFPMHRIYSHVQKNDPGQFVYGDELAHLRGLGSADLVETIGTESGPMGVYQIPN